jgi:V8-like Glu-specific endopeptidase
MPAIHPDDIDKLVDILSVRSTEPLAGGTQAYFINLISSSHLPNKWRASIIGGFTGNSIYNARNLVNWAIAQKINPEDPSYTTIGSILRALLSQELSPDDARVVVSIMVGYQLVLDKTKLNNLKTSYGVPVKPSIPVVSEINYGPDFDWLGPSSDLELQGFFTPELPWQDVGFLRRAMKCAASVCRVEIGKVTGTGFRVADALVLTNYHVLKPTDTDDLQANAAKAVVRFASYTSADGKAEEGLSFKLDAEPIVDQSVVAELDFVLLKVEPKILAAESIEKVELDPSIPAHKSALNILHHPGGETMKLSTSGNGVTGVYDDSGLVQYATKAAEGSSGSPCFTDDWKVVALHHAQRSRAFGSVREGILMKNILARIHQHLE